MKQTEFVVSRFVNRNGATSWRVAGWLHGVRIRKNLPSREEAAAEKAALEIKGIQAASGLRPALTCLSDDQLREAESVFRTVADRKRGLTFYVNFALSNYRDPENEKSLKDAASIYVALRGAEEKLGHLSHRQFQSFRCELRALTTHFPNANVSELTPTKLTAFFQRGHVSKKSYNNRRGLVSAFLKYGLLQDWIAANPIEKVPHFRNVGHRRGSAVTLSAARCAEIMEWCETNHDGKLVPFAALCLFAGIRPDLYEGEISKLKPEHVRLDTGVIFIEPEVSKVRMKRAITIQPNLAAWLRA